MFQPFVAGFDMVAINVDNMLDLEAFGARREGPGCW